MRRFFKIATDAYSHRQSHVSLKVRRTFETHPDSLLLTCMTNVFPSAYTTQGIHIRNIPSDRPECPQKRSNDLRRVNLPMTRKIALRAFYGVLTANKKAVPLFRETARVSRRGFDAPIRPSGPNRTPCFASNPSPRFHPVYTRARTRRTNDRRNSTSGPSVPRTSRLRPKQIRPPKGPSSNQSGVLSFKRSFTSPSEGLLTDLYSDTRLDISTSKRP